MIFPKRARFAGGRLRSVKSHSVEFFCAYVVYQRFHAQVAACEHMDEVVDDKEDTAAAWRD